MSKLIDVLVRIKNTPSKEVYIVLFLIYIWLSWIACQGVYLGGKEIGLGLFGKTSPASVIKVETGSRIDYSMGNRYNTHRIVYTFMDEDSVIYTGINETYESETPKLLGSVVMIGTHTEATCEYIPWIPQINALFPKNERSWWRPNACIRFCISFLILIVMVLAGYYNLVAPWLRKRPVFDS